MGPNSPAAAAPPRSFYKIILPSIIHDHKLRIPEDFAKAYENELSTFSTLIVPNGRVFRVKLEKAAKMLWLHNGWKKFAEYLSIRCGFFIVFNYVGNSKFKVHIFDLTATEIKYPENSMGSFDEPKNGSKSKVLQKRGRKRGRPSRQPHWSMSKPSPIASQDTSPVPSQDTSPIPSQDTSPVPSQDTIFNECSLQGVKRKRCFHSVLPMLFQFAPEFSMRIDNYGKCIPKSFLDSLRSNNQYETRNKQHKLEVFSGTANLKDVSAREGTSKIIVLSNSQTESENGELIPENDTSLVENSRFSNESDLQNCENAADKKSQQFAEDSEDRRLTTLSNKDENQVKVKQEVGEELIGVNDSNICPTRLMIQEKEKAVNAALMLKLRNPYFMNILKQHNVDLSFILHVPAYFGNKYLSDDTQFLKLEGPDGKHLEVSCFSDGEVKYLSRGWLMFVKEYNLVEGDVCIFELIQLDDVVLKVHIFRARQTSLDQGSDNSGLKPIG